MVREINRFVVVPPEGTPTHIAVAHVFDNEREAHRFAKQSNGAVWPAIDTDALIEHQEGEAA